MKTPFIPLAFTLALLGAGCQNREHASFSGSNVLVMVTNVLNVSSKIHIPETPPAPAPAESVPDAPNGSAQPNPALPTPNPPLTTHN